jgi:hypothetical protein
VKLTGVERIGRSELIPGVRPTDGRFSIESDMLTQALDHFSPDKTDDQGLGLLHRWHRDHETVWVYFATDGGGVSSSLLARIEQITRCLVLKNESSVLRFDLKNARVRYGPLQALLTPSRLGRAAILTRKPSGLAPTNGVIIALDSGHSLFICENKGSGAEWLELALGGVESPGLLGPGAV